MLSTTAKVFLALGVAQSVSATVSLSFTNYAGSDCTNFYGTSTLVSGYCVNIENFPNKSYGASAVAGVCDDASKSPVLQIFADPNCETGLLNAVAVGAEPVCVNADVTIQSVTVACV